jgi:hypothetical protein
MARSTILLFVIAIASYGKLITHSDQIHPNYRVQLPQLGDCFRDPIWEKVLENSFPQFDAVLHQTEDGRTLVGFLDRFSPGKLIIWTHLRIPPQDDAGFSDDEEPIRQLTQPPGPPGDPGTDPGDDPVHTPEPATFALVGLALIAVASMRYKRS